MSTMMMMMMMMMMMIHIDGDDDDYDVGCDDDHADDDDDDLDCPSHLSISPVETSSWKFVIDLVTAWFTKAIVMPGYDGALMFR